MHNLNEIFEEINLECDENARLAISVGFIAQKMLENPHNQAKPIFFILSSLISAHTNGQIKVYFDKHGYFSGYAIWASVNPEIEQRMLGEPQFVPNAQDCMSGDSLWITDLAIAGGQLDEVLADLRDNVFAKYQQVTYCRIKKNKRIAKRLVRNSKHAFFKAVAK